MEIPVGAYVAGHELAGHDSKYVINWLDGTGYKNPAATNQAGKDGTLLTMGKTFAAPAMLPVGVVQDYDNAIEAGSRGNYSAAGDHMGGATFKAMMLAMMAKGVKGKGTFKGAVRTQFATFFKGGRVVRMQYFNLRVFLELLKKEPGKVEGSIELYHKGELSGGKVSSTRSLSTGTDRASVEALKRPGKVHVFRVPLDKLRQWKLNNAIRELSDTDSKTGVQNNEIRIDPPESGQMNNYLVK